jgi:CBS domain-containing protein
VRDWAAIERETIDGFFRFSPTHARSVGDHRFDGVVGDLSRTAVRARLVEIDRQLSAIGRLDGLDRDQDIDRRALVAQLQAARFELTELKTPFTEPMFYAGGGTELDVSFYIKRPYAPLDERLAVLRRHLRGYGGYLEAARDNLEVALPRPNLEIAIDAIDGQAEYLDGEVRAAAGGDAETLSAVDAAAKQTRDFAQFLKARRATASETYALGETRFLRLLGLRELVPLSLPELERMVRTDIDRNRAAAEAAADRVAPGGGVPAALARLQDHHPTTSSIIADVAAMLDRLRGFILERDIVSLPDDGRCLVRPTPSYAAYISAAMDTAGPLETVATDSYYYVTVPGAEWGQAKSEEWLRYLNYATLEGTSIHEAYPGHYVQGLYERRAATPTRRLFWTYSTGEGFAHYVEEMMLEVGYSADPKLLLSQRLEALLRDCRFLVALGLHCQGMTMPDAIRLFQSEGFMTELPATREATRGAWDPMYLNYTLGKLLILELRHDVQRAADYSLKWFHDAFLGCGPLPIPLIRELIT